jgi:heme/copper-type cytochrome/quinol oxidase subunit 4
MELWKYFEWEELVVLITAAIILTALSVFVVQRLGFCKTGRNKEILVLTSAFVFTVLSFFVFYNREGAIADTLIQFIFTWFSTFLVYTKRGKDIIKKLVSLLGNKVQRK